MDSPDGMVEPQPDAGSKTANSVLSKDLLRGFMEVYRRKQNNKKLSREVIYKQEKIKKSNRRVSNKSRKINQAKNRLNKFQKKK